MRNSEKGVLPVPPTVRFPTDMIGTSNAFDGKMPQSKKIFRSVTTPLYTREIGHNNIFSKSGFSFISKKGIERKKYKKEKVCCPVSK